MRKLNEKEAVLDRSQKRCRKDFGRLELLKSYHAIGGDPYPDYKDVVKEWENGVHEEFLRTFVASPSDVKDWGGFLAWLEEWKVRRAVLVKRVGKFEKKLGIDRDIYSIDGRLIGGRYK